MIFATKPERPLFKGAKEQEEGALHLKKRD